MNRARSPAPPPPAVHRPPLRVVARPTLQLLTGDDALFARFGPLADRWTLQRLATPAEFAHPPAGKGIVIVDAELPGLPGWHDARWRAWAQHCSLVIASSRPSDDEGLAVLRAGAVGYCHAFAAEATWRQVLEVVASGELWVGRSLLARLLQAVDRGVAAHRPAPTGAVPDWARELTAREVEVARLTARGEPNLAIAAALGITERTVKAHLSAIFDKLGVADRLQLALTVHGLR